MDGEIIHLCLNYKEIESIKQKIFIQRTTDGWYGIGN